MVHGNRARACKRKTKEKEVKRVVELAKGKYLGFNVQSDFTAESLSTQRKDNRYPSAQSASIVFHISIAL